MDKAKTYVDPQKLVDVANTVGLAVTEQSGFFKVHGPKGRFLYIGKGKSTCRVDLSGWTVEKEYVVDLKGESFGAVKQQLSFVGRTEEDVLSAFVELAGIMKSLPPREKEKRTMAPKGPSKKEGTVQKTPEELRSERIKHLERVLKIASDKGVSVSKKVTEELASLTAQA